ncbi:hypothetical protein CDAR_542541 [Caerostris darwini]|uniref:Uncharacterized protein n=1 Tax=Caerostris darwini TaxID=1538125 RepID=A0AAV4RRG7_9ARAC|nr:hypothetical protein CDAR_542541 [Caerostris darwini]
MVWWLWKTDLWNTSVNKEIKGKGVMYRGKRNKGRECRGEQSPRSYAEINPHPENKYVRLRRLDWRENEPKEQTLRNEKFFYSWALKKKEYNKLHLFRNRQRGGEKQRQKKSHRTHSEELIPLPQKAAIVLVFCTPGLHFVPAIYG